MKIAQIAFILGALIFSVSAFAHDYTDEDMERYGRHAAMGEMDAVDKLSDIFSELSSGFDHEKDPARVGDISALMKVAFDKIASEVKSNDASDPAFQALLYATGKQNINWYAADALGTAAAAGNDPSLDVLLHYKEHGILLSAATRALVASASKNNKDAVDFLINVMNDDHDKGLWMMASQGLIAAANDGNEDAKAAVAKYANSGH